MVEDLSTGTVKEYEVTFKRVDSETEFTVKADADWFTKYTMKGIRIMLLSRLLDRLNAKPVDHPFTLGETVEI